MMTDQEIFDKVKTHLLTQNERSLQSTDGRCVYRGPGGLKCAIGCLIPDEVYTSDIEGIGVSDPRFRSTLECALGCPPPTTFALLKRLQHCHDHIGPELWAARLSSIAKNFNLKYEEQAT